MNHTIESKKLENQKKLERLYVTYRELMYRKAIGILNNHEDAEDALQEAFLKIEKHLDHIEDVHTSKTKNLLLKIVKNTAIDMYRHKKTFASISLDEIQEPAINEHIPDTSLNRCISELPEIYQTALMLKAVLGYSTKEASKILDLPEETFRKRYYRAKRQLEIICKRNGIF